MRACIDTNVLFEGLTDADSDGALIVEAWLSALFTPCVSDAVAYEYYDVLSRQLSPRRWREAQPVLARLLTDAAMVSIHFRWRPSSRDAADDMIVDCAMNANACIVTYNRKDFAMAQKTLGLIVFAPHEFIEALVDEIRSSGG